MEVAWIVCHTAVGRDAVEVAIGEQALCQRRETDEACLVLGYGVQYAFCFGRLVEEVEPTLVYEAWDVVLLEVVVTF